MIDIVIRISLICEPIQKPLSVLLHLNYKIVFMILCSVFEAERPGCRFSIEQRVGTYFYKVCKLGTLVLIISLGLHSKQHIPYEDLFVKWKLFDIVTFTREFCPIDD